MAHAMSGGITAGAAPGARHGDDPARRLQFAVDRVEVALHRADRQEELRRDRLVRQPVRDQLCHKATVLLPATRCLNKSVRISSWHRWDRTSHFWLAGPPEE
jgi:hypothetical protein